jgi:hypothetical protein
LELYRYLGENVSIDVALVEECRESFKRALELLEEIEKQILKFCDENGMVLAFRESRFEPFHIAENTEYLMVYRAYLKSQMGYIVVTKDGTIAWKGKIVWRRK